MEKNKRNACDGESNRQASDGEEQELGKRWGRAKDRQPMGKSEMQIIYVEEQEIRK